MATLEEIAQRHKLREKRLQVRKIPLRGHNVERRTERETKHSEVYRRQDAERLKEDY